LFQSTPRGKIDPILTRSTVGLARRAKNKVFGRISRRKAMSAVALTVNGKAVTGDVDPRTLLVQYLREHLRLTGTHVGCDTSQCGACVVHVDGKAVKACTVFVWQLEGANVTTIEGLAEPSGPLHPMQEAFREHHGLQCGYCTPGMIMTAVDMVNRKGNELDDPTIRHELEGNLCRCTGYHNIVKAIAAGAKAMGKGQVQPTT
jgi:carbon-monoxide dehydrogenase small subunit